MSKVIYVLLKAFTKLYCVHSNLISKSNQWEYSWADVCINKMNSTNDKIKLSQIKIQIMAYIYDENKYVNKLYYLESLRVAVPKLFPTLLYVPYRIVYWTSVSAGLCMEIFEIVGFPLLFYTYKPLEFLYLLVKFHYNSLKYRSEQTEEVTLFYTM